MMKREYSTNQFENAKRLMDILSVIPEKKQEEIIQMMEAMILGAEMATRLSATSKETA